MRQAHAKDVYEYYGELIEKFLLNGDSYLTDRKGILTVQNIQNCLNNFVVNYKAGGESFDEKVIEQFKDADMPTRLVFAHAEYLWCFAVSDKTIERKKEYTRRTTDITDDASLKNVYPDGFGHAGQWHNQNKHGEIKYILLIIQFLKEKVDNEEITSVADVLEWIEHISLYQKYEKITSGYELSQDLIGALPDVSLAVSNILLHISNPDQYERIASDNHKVQIISAFSGILPNEDTQDGANTDQKILSIRNELSKLTGKSDFDFYENQYAQVWNYSLTEEGFSEVQGLQYKKAIILYGPPGTSKTYTARRLATALITSAYLKNKENILKYFNNSEDYSTSRIHSLQLHPNYSYEDFVAGIQLRDNSTKVVEGKLFSICAAAKKDMADKPKDDMPHVLILDEINRIDLSRLLGEVFSALENRDEPIEVGVGDLKLTIPRNLYIIGTMNEIDFSLERIDFALRRRFLWFFYGFNADVLSSIIDQQNRDLKTKLKPGEVERFIKNAKDLNAEITRLDELGEQYQIGHTFFGEIVNIYKSYVDLKGYKSLQKQFYRKQGPAEILWDISIQPIITAFLGNMDSDTRKEKITNLKNIYDR